MTVIVEQSDKELITYAEAVRVSGQTLDRVRKAVDQGALRLYRTSWKHCWLDANEVRAVFAA